MFDKACVSRDNIVILRNWKDKKPDQPGGRMMQYLGALEVAFPSEGVELAQIEREKHDGVKPIPDKG